MDEKQDTNKLLVTQRFRRTLKRTVAAHYCIGLRTAIAGREWLFASGVPHYDQRANKPKPNMGFGRWML